VDFDEIFLEEWGLDQVIRVLIQVQEFKAIYGIKAVLFAALQHSCWRRFVMFHHLLVNNWYQCLVSQLSFVFTQHSDAFVLCCIMFMCHTV